ncbi:LysR family transcriptional regulator [Martelella soudanensis]|uniref:LysR family transcriptional regulator n=1 Tax=unclassified Martelella TaxID=2629616 RepID=UPI0015DEC501|nr:MULTISPECIES: LysR family transcriptional regulator [unclassified Martelella]
METAFFQFETVAELGSIRKASEQLHISPSSVSRQIQKLEYTYGVELLVRQSQGVRLTPAGELILRYVKGRNKELQRLRAEIDALKNLESGHVIVYTVEGMIGGLLPRALARFGRHHPNITYQVMVAGTDGVMRAVAEDRCDIGISFQPFPRADIDTLLSLRQPVMAVMSRHHPLAGKQELTLGEARDQPVGLPDRSFGIRQLVDHVVKSEQLALNIRLETNSIDMMRQFALQDMGIVFLPAFSFERELASGELIGVPVKSTVLTLSTTEVCKRAEVELSPAARRLVDYIRQVADEFVGVA